MKSSSKPSRSRSRSRSRTRSTSSKSSKSSKNTRTSKSSKKNRSSSSSARARARSSSGRSRGREGGAPPPKPHPPRALRPPVPGVLDFSLFIADKTRGFVGRKDLFARVRRWLESKEETQRVLLITGDPGIGKTAIIAGLSVDPAWASAVVAVHFCRYDDPVTLDGRKCVKSLLLQLQDGLNDELELSKNDDWRQCVEEVMTSQGGPVDTFTRAIAVLKGVKAPSEHCLMLIDSLDEAVDAGGMGGREIVRALGASTLVLPVWLKILATSRKDPVILNKLLPPLRAETIEATEKGNLEDLRAFVEAQVGPGATAEAVLGSSRGNFLYVRQLFDSGEDLSQLVDGELPQGLVALYGVMAKRLWPTLKEYRTVLPVLNVLVASLGPIPIELLSQAAKRDVTIIVQSLETVLERNAEGRIRIYHKSFADWLVDEEHCGERADVEAGHAALAEVALNGAWNKYEYALLYMMAHVHQAKGYDHLLDKAQKVTMSWDWLSMRGGIDVGELISDLALGTELMRIASRVARQAQHDGLKGVASGLALYMGRFDGAEGLVSDLAKVVPIFSPTGKLFNGAHVGSLVFAASGPRLGTSLAQVDEQRLVCGRRDGKLQVWNLEGVLEETFEVASPSQPVLVQSLGGEEILASFGSCVHVQRADGGFCLEKMDPEDDAELVSAIAVLGSGLDTSLVAVGYESGFIRVFRRAGKNQNWIRVGRSHSHIGAVEDIASLVSSVFVSCGGNNMVLVSSMSPSGEFEVTPMEMDPEARQVTMPTAVAPLVNGAGFVVGSGDWTLRVYATPNTGREPLAPVRVLKGHKNAILSVKTLVDGVSVASCGYDSLLIIWDTREGTQKRMLRGPEVGILYDVAVLSNGYLATLGSKSITLWDPAVRGGAAGRAAGGAAGRAGDQEGIVSAYQNAVGVTDSGRWVSGGADGQLVLWSRDSRVEASMKAHNRSIVGIAVAGKSLAVIGRDNKMAGSLSWWKVTASELKESWRQTQPTPLVVMRCVAILDSEKEVAVAGLADFSVNVVNSSGWATVGSHTRAVSAVLSVGDKTRFVSLGWDGCGYMWTQEGAVRGFPRFETPEGVPLIAGAIATENMILAGLNEGTRLYIWSLVDATLTKSIALGGEGSLIYGCMAWTGRRFVVGAPKMRGMVAVEGDSWSTEELRLDESVAAMSWDGGRNELGVVQGGSVVLLQFTQD